MKPDTEFKDTWRYLTDLPSHEIPSTGLDDEYVFYPRHLKVLYITPVQGKICLRPIRREESVFTVERQRTHVNVSLSVLLAIYHRNETTKIIFSNRNINHLRRNPPDVGVTSGQKSCTKINYIVSQTSVGIF